MTKIDIFSGFLGAGKTTLIKKLITEAYKGEKVVLIENEFGEIGIDGGFLKDAGIEITEMNSGCICCTLVGDFTEALKKVLAEYTPDRIVIEPSGVGKLSDVIRAVEKIDSKDTVLNAFTTVVDAKKCKVYLKNFGEFFIDQVENASAIVLSHTAGIDNEKLHNCIHLLREHNSNATIVSTDWNLLTGAQILEATEKKNTLEHHIHSLEHHHDHDEHCDSGCHDHEHHHDHDEHCDCGCHDHEHHHHADEVFSSFGRETAKKFTAEFIKEALSDLENQEKYGIILRAKGIVEGENGEWIHFDYIPGEPDVRLGRAEIIGRLCVIGSKINEQAIAELFGV